MKVKKIRCSTINLEITMMYHCENCKTQFVAIPNFQFCFSCGLKAMFPISNELPFIKIK